MTSEQKSEDYILRFLHEIKIVQILLLNSYEKLNSKQRES